MEQLNTLDPAMGHARIAPSKLDKIAICAARVDREANYPDETAPEAERGTRIHLAAAECIRAWAEDAPATPAYDEFVEAGDTAAVTMIDQYVEYIERRYAELLPCAVRIEVLVNPGAIIGRTDHWGTCDCALIGNKILEAIDLKSGGWLVEPTTLQLRTYAAGLLHQYTDAAGKVYPFETVRCTIFQPKRPGMNEIARWVDYTVEEILEWAREDLYEICIATEMNAAGDPPVATPSEDGCKFCKARNDCPELQATITKGLEDLTAGTGDMALLFSQEPIAVMSVEELAALLNVRPLIEARLTARFDEAAERVKAILERHEPVPGWKLVRGKSNRAWALPDEDLVKKLKNLKLKKNQIYREVLRSPAQMQSVGLQVEKWQAVQKLIVKPEGALILAPESDTRENAMPMEMFQPIKSFQPIDATGDGYSLPDFLS